LDKGKPACPIPLKINKRVSVPSSALRLHDLRRE
jgi:hypothetical protein